MNRIYFFTLLLLALLPGLCPVGLAATGPITGDSTLCQGSTGTVSDTTPGGSWTSGNTTVVTINNITGVMTAISHGIANITYSGPGVFALKTIMVSDTPVISPTSTGSYCAKSSVFCFNSVPGANYYLYSTSGLLETKSGTGSVLCFSTFDSAGTYSVIATNATTGCAGKLSPILVNPIPTAISGPSSLCVNSSTSFSDAVSGGIWSSSNTAVSAINAVNGSDTALAAGTATISYTNTFGCSATKAITVNALPLPDTVMGGGSYCTGTPGVHVFTNYSRIGNKYTLYINDTAILPAQAGINSSIDFGAQTKPGIYKVIVTNNATGCSNKMIDSAIVTQNAPPTAFGLTGGSHYCLGDTGVHIKTTGSDTGVSYTLRLGTSPVTTKTGTGGVIDFGLFTAAGLYSVIAVNTHTSCNDTFASTMNITIDSLPRKFLVSGIGGFCSGGTGDTVRVDGTMAGINYYLYLGPTLISIVPGTGTPIYFGPETTVGVYRVVAVNTLTGCAATMNGKDSVYVNPLPQQDTVIGGGSYCAGGTGAVVGMDFARNGYGYQLYLGSSPVGSSVPGSNAPLFFGPQMVAATYSVVATNSSTGCSRSMLHTVAVVVTPTVVPTVSLAVTPGDTICPGTIPSFIPTATNGGPKPKYNWFVNSIFIDTGAFFTYTPANGDVVTAEMTSSAACAVPSTVSASITMAVNIMPAITSVAPVCPGASLSLSDAIPGGIWSTSDSSIATISAIGGSPGAVSGVAAGTAVISYLLTTGCYAVATVVVLPAPIVAATSSSSCSEVYALAAAGAVSYSWSPSAGLSCTTCDTLTATVSATTTYVVTGTDAAGCTGTATVKLNGNRIYGQVSFAGLAPDTLDMKVWLIQFNPSDSSAIAIDSVLTCTTDSTGYYEFNGKPTGSYYVRAMLLHSDSSGATRYMPTYGTSSSYWHDANPIAHAGSSDEAHIVIQYCTAAGLPGSGFISGNVYGPAGMLIYLKDLTGAIRAFTYTGPTGYYFFKDLAYGDYIVYPEQYDYNTIPSDFITLNESSGTALDVSFRQYTFDRIIAPSKTMIAAAGNVDNAGSFRIYPNPSAGTITLSWKELPTGVGTITVHDVTGREVYNSSLNIDAATGSIAIDLGELYNGIYIATIVSGPQTHNAQIVIQK